MLVGLFLSLAAAGDRTLPPPPTALALTSEPDAAGMKPAQFVAFRPRLRQSSLGVRTESGEFFLARKTIFKSP